MFCYPLNGSPAAPAMDHFEEGLQLFLARHQTPLEKLEVTEFRLGLFKYFPTREHEENRGAKEPKECLT